jgi:biotin-(acetyl-CoA carboxylase) ligase
VWRQPEGESLAVSLIVRWPEGPDRVKLPVETGILLARGLSASFGLDVRLKWPNDLLVSRKKLGGLLVEARANAEGEGYAVVGIGVNVGATRAQLDAAALPDATSLKAAGAPEESLSGDAPLLALLSILEEGLLAPKPVLPEAFEEVSAHSAGDRLTVADGDRTVEGTYLGVTPEGFLRLAVASGEERVVSGDVAFF